MGGDAVAFTGEMRCVSTLTSMIPMWRESPARWKACTLSVRDAAMKSKLPERRVHRRAAAQSCYARNALREKAISMTWTIGNSSDGAKRDSGQHCRLLVDPDCASLKPGYDSAKKLKGRPLGRPLA